MKILKRTVLTFLALIALVLLVALFIETEYSVSKTITINRDKESVYDVMVDFKDFGKWSPWSELDSAMSVSYGGTSGKVGSSYTWSGNEDVGSGTMTISKLSPDTIFVDLSFKEPFEAQSPTYYALKSIGANTEVTWFMAGEMPYPFNVMTLFISMEEAIGKDFDRGLEKLKGLMEEQD
jgi:hypothetical protein